MHETLYRNGRPRAFAESTVLDRLSHLSTKARSVFAWSCSARLFPGYRRWHQEVGSIPDSFVQRTLIDVRERLHKASEGALFPELSHNINVLLDLMPTEDSAWSPSHPIAEHAVASLAYTLRSMMTGDPQEATWAARRAYEAADYLAISELEPGGTVYPEENKVLAHSAVQTELARQEYDFDLIAEGAFDAVLDADMTFSVFEY
jgi:hypothetical protein